MGAAFWFGALSAAGTALGVIVLIIRMSHRQGALEARVDSQITNLAARYEELRSALQPLFESHRQSSVQLATLEARADAMGDVIAEMKTFRIDERRSR